MMNRNMIGMTASGVAGILMGATGMYLLDPARGRARRAHVREKLYSWSRRSWRLVLRKERHLRNVAQGTLYEFRKSRQSPVTEEVVSGRLGRAA